MDIIFRPIRLYGLVPMTILIMFGIGIGKGAPAFAKTPWELSPSINMLAAEQIWSFDSEEAAISIPEAVIPEASLSLTAVIRHPAAVNAARTWSVNGPTSALSNNLSTAIEVPAKGFSLSRKARAWLCDNDLGANFSSILTLANRSCSAFSFASAAFAFASAALCTATKILSLDSRWTTSETRLATIPEMKAEVTLIPPAIAAIIAAHEDTAFQCDKDSSHIDFSWPPLWPIVFFLVCLWLSITAFVYFKITEIKHGKSRN
ncbi:MAG: hypothetical protein HY914_03615 [Desulfomonile tiedjei]|nr:hypothetical protein [Desulfomonile tiedjei]